MRPSEGEDAVGRRFRKAKGMQDLRLPFTMTLRTMLQEIGSS